MTRRLNYFPRTNKGNSKSIREQLKQWQNRYFLKNVNQSFSKKNFNKDEEWLFNEPSLFSFSSFLSLSLKGHLIPSHFNACKLNREVFTESSEKIPRDLYNGLSNVWRVKRFRSWQVTTIHSVSSKEVFFLQVVSTSRFLVDYDLWRVWERIIIWIIFNNNANSIGFSLEILWNSEWS